MSAVAAAIEAMRAKGIADSDILDIVAHMAAAETVSTTSTRTARQERNARYYASQKRLKASYSDDQDGVDVPPKKETSPTPPKEKTTPLSSDPTGLRCLSGREFSDFWEAYPRRTGSNSRKNAELRFNSARKAGVLAETMIDGAKRYAAHCDATGIAGTGFVKMTEAWINGRLWESDYSPSHGPPSRPAKRNTALDGLDELERRYSTNVQQPHLRIAG